MDETIESGDEPLPDQPSLKTLSSLKQAVWQRSPIFRDIIQRDGHKKLQDYTWDFFRVPTADTFASRRHELISVAQSLATERLGDHVGQAVARQLQKYPVVSTADHHGPIDHPFFVNANIIASLPYHQHHDPDLRHLVVFSFSSISINNASAYPRGIIFHGGINGSSNLIRIPFLPDREKMGVTYTMRAYTHDDLTRAHQTVDHKCTAGDITTERRDAVHQCINTYFADADVLEVDNLTEQITKINFSLWPNLFRGQDIEQTTDVPDLIYLDIETLVTRLLSERHLHDAESPIYKLLLDPAYRAAALRHFDGIPGAFTAETGAGTHFFWALNDRKHRKRMNIDGDRFFADGMDYTLPLTPESLSEALRTKRIMPSMMLCYVLVALYYGMKCLGGFSQVNDLTDTKHAWQRVLRDNGDTAEAEAVEPVYTTAYGGDGLVLSYIPTVTGSLVPATGIDMLFRDVETNYDHFLQLAKTLTLEQISNPMLPEIYSIYYSAADRTPALQSLTPERILKLTRVDKKLVQVQSAPPRSATPTAKQPRLSRKVSATL